MKQARHPTLPVTLTFDPASHTYRDDDNQLYQSVTALVKAAFPPFDAPEAAQRIAERDGRLALDVLAEWRANGKSACETGNRVHAYAEAVLLGLTVPTPVTDDEARRFEIVDKALAGLAGAGYRLIAVEQIVFDPLVMVAGQADIIMRAPSGALAILDWKTCEDITTDAYGRTALPPIAHVPDSKAHHYALQLSLYAWMLTAPGWTAYPTEGEPVELALIHCPHVGYDPVWRPMPYLADEVTAIMEARL